MACIPSELNRGPKIAANLEQTYFESPISHSCWLIKKRRRGGFIPKPVSKYGKITDTIDRGTAFEMKVSRARHCTIILVANFLFAKKIKEGFIYITRVHFFCLDTCN